MPSKNTKRARRAQQNKNGNVAASKDDGTRWLVVRHGAPVYSSRVGTTRAEAERLAAGLLGGAELIQVSSA